MTDKARRVGISWHEIEVSVFTGGLGSEQKKRVEVITDSEDGHFVVVENETWELSKSHFIEMDKLLAEYRRNERRLIVVLKEFAPSACRCDIEPATGATDMCDLCSILEEIEARA